MGNLIRARSPQANKLQRAWRAKNPERVRAYATKYKAQHGEKRKQLGREANWSRKGLPVPLRPIPILCECCSRPPKSGRALHLDHDHVTGKFRGWLCASCNLAIGKLGDNLPRVLMAVAYLMAHD
jgi:hypothetical protein